jgi:hypothetical protein
MKQKLIKVSETQFIVVDNSEIKIGDFFIFKNKEQIITQAYLDELTLKSNGAEIFKVTHATEQIEELKGVRVFHKVKRISLENCKAIENGYDLNELSLNFVSRDGLFVRNPYNEAGWIAATNGFIEGFQKALEILEEKNKELYEFARDCSANWDCDNDGHKYDTPCRMCDAKKLLKQTEWEVVIEMEVVSDFDSRAEIDGQVFSTNKKQVPKLDANGFITLKRKV